MAMIDYGALLRVDGKLINRNAELFMDASDTGYACKWATDKNRERYLVEGNYFVQAGDKDFLLLFYKGQCLVVSNERILYEFWRTESCSETRYFDGLPAVKVSRLSQEYSRKFWDIDIDDYDWLCYRHRGKHRADRWIRRQYKKRHKTMHGHGNLGYKARPFRFLAEWEYDGRKYEVIFGYGIDQSETVWNRIKYSSYGFRAEEIDVIDSWFEGE